MTNDDYTKYDEALLSACKHYIRITDIDAKSFINEICEMAQQYCQNLPSDILEIVPEDKAK